MGSRVELFEAIRRDALREDLSIRALAERHNVHRRTVRAALASSVPPARKAPVRETPVREAPKLGPARPLIDAMLREDLEAPRKQRHTARRVLARLVDEHELVELTYGSVRDYVARRRQEILIEAGRALRRATSRRRMSRGRRPRSTSPTCGSSSAGS